MKKITLILLTMFFTNVVGINAQTVATKKEEVPKVVKEEDLSKMFAKEIKFSSDAVDQKEIEKEIDKLNDGHTDRAVGSMFEVYACNGLPTIEEMRACQKEHYLKKRIK